MALYTNALHNAHAFVLMAVTIPPHYPILALGKTRMIV